MEIILGKNFARSYANLGEFYEEIANYYAFAQRHPMKVHTRRVPLADLEAVARIAAEQVKSIGSLPTTESLSSRLGFDVFKAEKALRVLVLQVPNEAKQYYPQQQYTVRRA